MTRRAQPPRIDAEAVHRLVPMAAAIDAVEHVLAGGLDPEAGPARAALDVPAGQLLLMPAVAAGYAGVKLASVAPGNPGRGLPRIQAVYVLFDASTLTPVAVLDGTALTSLRTPAVSAVAARHLADPAARRLVVFGTGPQAWGHVTALRAVLPVVEIGVVGRDRDRLAAFVNRGRETGMRVEPVTPDAVAGADLVACCTSARTPLFEGADLPDGCTVLAIGSHEADAREVDQDTVLRSTVVVEARSAALREAGDLLLPMRSGAVPAGHIAGSLAELVRGEVPVDPARPRLFKGVGMAWQDLVVAATAYERWRSGER
ncbi:MAG: ornithine cyclodeaminase family protein [Carbonactinosporaceae bacterium]